MNRRIKILFAHFAWFLYLEGMAILICKNCGKEVKNIKKYCDFCGVSMAQTVEFGFSDKIHDIFFYRKIMYKKIIIGIISFIIVILPLVVFAMIGVLFSDFQLIPIGIISSLILMIVFFIYMCNKNMSSQWDGIVIEKSIEKSLGKNQIKYKGEILYIIKIRIDNGRYKKIIETEKKHPYYEYLNVNDKVRFHPNFNNFYEKYDKTKDEIVICPFCRNFTDVKEKYCSTCGAMLIK